MVVFWRWLGRGARAVTQPIRTAECQRNSGRPCAGLPCQREQAVPDTQVYYINLDRAPERAVHMEGSLSRLGLASSSTRISAIDAKKENVRDGFRRRLAKRHWDLAISEKACLESHRLAWLTMIERGDDMAVILEDDVVFSDSFPSVLEHIRNADLHFDIIKLDGVPIDVRMGAAVACGAIRLRPILQMVFSAAAYLVTREAAMRLVRETETYQYPVDHLITTPRRGWVMFQALPACCCQGMLLLPPEGVVDHAAIYQSHRLEGVHFMQQTPPPPKWFRTKNMVRKDLNKLVWKLWKRRALVRGGGVIEPVELACDLARYR